MKLTKVRDLHAGDLVDMENIVPGYDNPLAEFEYGEVQSVEEETPTCFVIDFGDCGTIALSPEHKVPVKDETDQLESGEMGAEEYAALWGADPVYMQAPNEPGDGYLFYNFSVEGNDPGFLKKFIPAIERTIARCKIEEDRESDIQGLEYLREICQERISTLAG